MKFKNTVHKKRAGVPKRALGALTRGAFMASLMLSFTFAQELAPVNLGSTANFAILAGALVSNVPTSAVTGDVGLSPAAGSYISGFGLTEVSGTIYTADATGPAGSVTSAAMLTAAKGDLTIAYNDAKGRVPIPAGAYLDTLAGEIGGLTLGPGLYKFTGTLSITGSYLTLEGSSTDVWIFQIAENLVVADAIHVILAGGALPANIFWQVGTSATLGSTSVFKGTILADQSISLSTGATLDGRALARIAAVTIETSIITAPGFVYVAIDDEELVPDGFSLSQNFPNPFNPSTMINYQLPVSSQVTLTITDMLGQELDVLVNDTQSAGSHQIEWNAENYTSGIYFYRLQAGSFASVKQMILIK
ncbi:MAG: ice-binding family protein [Candidatus Marinimicrobia bacterium]|nr:ice-binding family protein [Candidatus Neomarinimicrobiota bacterium]